MDLLLQAVAEALAAPGPFALAFAVIVVAGVVQSTAGLGFGLVAAPVLMFLNPALVPGGVIFLGTLVSLLSALRDLGEVNGRYVAAGLVGRAPAALVAASLVAQASRAVFEVLFAVSILLAVALSLAAPRFAPTVPRVAAAGVASGLMGTLTGVGAPPFGIALQNAAPAEMRATMNAVLLLGAVISMSALAWFGAFGLVDILKGAALVPAALLGFWLARFVLRDPRTTGLLRPSVLVLCSGASLVLLARALL